MAQKTWRLVVTELGNADSLHEVSIEAGNWMTALKVGRKKIGEDGGVPTGASCAVAPDGKVTIHDPLARRSYVLFPGGKPKSDGQAAEVPAPSEAPKAAGPRSDAPRADAARADAEKKKKLNKTLAYDTRAAKKPASSYSVPAPEPKSARSLAPAAAGPAVAHAAPERSEPRSEPVPKVSDTPVAEIETASGSDFRLLSRRDEAPTTETPLYYRERVYTGAPDMTSERAEEILRGRFAELRESLAHATPGKFFHLAIFDHEFPLGPDGRGRPLRPPLATLVYKDWRGEALVQFPLEESRGTTPEPMRTPDKPGSVPPPARPLSTPPPAVALAASQPPVAAEPSAPPSEPPLPIAPVSIEPRPVEPVRVAPASQPPMQIAEPRIEVKPEPKYRQKRTTTDEHDARLAHAFEAGQDLLFLTTPVEGLDFVVKLLGELVPCEAVSACLYDIDTDEFRFVSMSGPGSDERRGEAVPRAMGIMGAVAEMHDSAALRLTQPVSDPRFDPGVDGRVGLEPRDVLYQPVTHHGLLLGVLQLLNRASGRGFSESDADLVAYVARQAGEFLHQARMSAPGPSMSGMPRR